MDSLVNENALTTGPGRVMMGQDDDMVAVTEQPWIRVRDRSTAARRGEAAMAGPLRLRCREAEDYPPVRLTRAWMSGQ